MKDVNLYDKQVHNFAMTIYAADILSYIETNKAEYEEFIADEESNDWYGDATKNRNISIGIYGLNSYRTTETVIYGEDSRDSEIP